LYPLLRGVTVWVCWLSIAACGPVAVGDASVVDVTPGDSRAPDSAADVTADAFVLDGADASRPADGGSDSGAGTATDGDAGRDAVVPDASPRDAASAADAGCNDLPFGAAADNRTVAALPPRPMGGVIAPGRYLLTVVTRYSGPDGGTSPDPETAGLQSTWEFVGDRVAMADRQIGMTSRAAARFVTTGSALALMPLCSSTSSSTSSFALPYTATATTVAVYSDRNGWFTYTRQ
jgi:hypothetical protein